MIPTPDRGALSRKALAELLIMQSLIFSATTKNGWKGSNGPMGFSNRCGRFAASVILAAAVALCGGAPDAAGLTAFGEFSSGGWTGACFRDDYGAFNHCHITAGYQSGVDLYIGLTRDSDITLVLTNKGWELSGRGPYETAVRVDRARVGAFEVVTLGPHALLINLGGRRSVFDLLRRGRSMIISAVTADLQFDLTGSSAALLKLQESVDAAKASYPPDKNPFESPEKRNGLLEAMQDLRATVKRILESSGMDGVVLVDPAQSAYDFADIAWKTETVQGFAQLNLVDKEDGIERIVEKFLGGLALGCDGIFGSQVLKVRDFGTFSIRQFYAGCSLRDLTVYSAFTVVQADEMSLLIGNNTDFDPNIVKTLNRNLEANIVESMNAK